MTKGTTDWYIDKISKLSNPFGDKLLELLDETHKMGLAEVTLEEAKDYYKRLVKRLNEK